MDNLLIVTALLQLFLDQVFWMEKSVTFSCLNISVLWKLHVWHFDVDYQLRVRNDMFLGSEERWYNRKCIIFCIQSADGAFEAFPLHEWYNFTPVAKYKSLNAEVMDSCNLK